jgi:hypothetical protein|tara:strand:- start:335 stop:568 length:234 start_codon:yes stop_codon:yes gene_type:complete
MNHEFETIFTRIDDDGSRLVFGFPVFSAWLPFIGFETIIEYDDIMNPTSKIVIKIFKVEWLLHGFAFVYDVNVTDQF